VTVISSALLRSVRSPCAVSPDIPRPKSTTRIWPPVGYAIPPGERFPGPFLRACSFVTRAFVPLWPRHLLRSRSFAVAGADVEEIQKKRMSR
jgi:hypothetical protein